MLPTQLVNVQNFKPASTSKIASAAAVKRSGSGIWSRAIQPRF